MHIYFNWTSLRCNKKKFDLARETGEEEKKITKKKWLADLNEKIQNKLKKRTQLLSLSKKKFQ